DALDAAAQAEQAVARVHLKIDTGIHRSGCDASLWPELCQRAATLEAAGHIRIVGIWSHLYHGLEHDGGEGNRRQTDRLREALAAADEAGLAPEHIHLANSAGSIRLPEVG